MKFQIMMTARNAVKKTGDNLFEDPLSSIQVVVNTNWTLRISWISQHITLRSENSNYLLGKGRCCC